MREWKKERIQKKMIGILLAVVLIFYMLPVSEFAISISALAETTIAETPIEQTVTVDVAETQNLADGYYKIDEEGTITSSTESEYNLHFDQSTNILTLKDAIIPEGNNIGINFHYATDDAKATIELIGKNKITSKNYAIKAERNGSLPSTSADVDVELTICGSGSLETSSEWGIQATNLTIDGSTVNITTGGHTALNISRDLIIRNAAITTKDTGDGGDFYISRSLQIMNSTILSDIQVEYPSIYLANTYCPDEYLIEPAVVIKESDLMVGGQADSSLGFSLYVTKGGAEISDTTLTAVNNRMGLFVANGALEISGTSTIETGSKLAVRSKESVKIGENVSITGSIVDTIGSIADGYRFINNGFICLPENITEEQLKNFHYYGGGTVKIGDNKTYHSVRFDLEDTIPLDKIETQWILDGEIAVPLEDPEKDGFRFLGWVAEENSEIWDFQNDKVTKSLLFSPQWEHVHSWDYTLDGTSTIKATCTANGCDNREQSITIYAPIGDLTYDGLQKEATLDGTIDGIEPEINYSTEDNSIPVNAGSYTASITIGEQTASVTYEIAKAIPVIGTVTVNEIENTLDISKVVLSYTNQEIAGTLKLVDSTLKYGTHTYSWEFIPEGDSKENYQSITGTIEITVKDTIAPTAAYQIETGEWKKFINTISFGFFCNDYKNVTIDFTDDTDTIIGSGIAEKQYVIVDKEITDIESIEWKDYKEKLSLNANGIYFIYVKVTDNAGNTAIFNSEGIVIYKESTLSQTEIDYTYKQNKDCIIGLSMNGNTFKEVTDQAGNVIENEHYTIDENGNLTLKSSYLDTLKKGEYTYKIIMNPQGVETDKITVAYTFIIKVKAAEVRIVNATAKDRDYNGTNIVEITEITLSDIREDDNVTIDLSNIQGTLSSANAGTYTSVTLPELTLIGEAKDNYTLIQPTQAVATSVTIYPLDAEIIVGTESYKKTFGDKDFSLDVTDNNEEADVQYTITEGTDIISIQDNMVMIKEAGTAIITASLQASANYNAAEDKIITVYVEKKSGYKVDAINKNYLYMKEHTESIDLASLLPEDCGMVSYEKPSVSGTVDFKMVAVTEGKLSYTLESGEKNEEGTITVIAKTKNYTDIVFMVNVKLTDQIPVNLKQGTEVTLKEDTLNFGETLSKLIFNPAEFVDSDGNLVEGTLTWKDGEIKPEVGTKSAFWVFTPTRIEYTSVEGMVGITVKKAIPVIEEVPTVVDRVYNPSITLKDSDLIEGNAEIAGIWSWQDTEIVPSVNNSGYQAVFTPVDDSNYEIVTKTIPVTVTKATPYIQTIPSASAINYGDTLNDSSLTKGMVQYSSLDNTKVAGSFTWKDTSIKPVAADSDHTEYPIIFTPADEINYNSIETVVTLTVNKAENTPNMPANKMNVPNSYKKVSDVELPIGWSWQDTEKDTILEMGKPIEATAIYIGEDKDNYKNVTVLVSIIRSDCEHKNTEQKNIVSATCEKEGYTGDLYCKDCGVKIKSGTVISATGHNYNQEIANENTLKSAATIWSAEVYFKSCHCGAMSKTETFLSGEPLNNPSSPSSPSSPTNPSTPTISTPSVPSNENNNSSSDKNETNNNDNSGSNSNTNNEETSSDNDNKQEDLTKEVITETKPDGTKVETITETNSDGAKIETITETKLDGTVIVVIKDKNTDGSSTETKEITTGDNNVTLKTIVETNASGSRNVNAIIYTGISNTDNTVEIQEELLNNIAEESELKTVIIEITDTTVKTAVASNKNVTININIPSVEGVGIEKIILNKDSIYTAKEIGKGLIVKIIDSDTKEIANNYKVKIPAKQLEKIDSSVEEINIMIKTENAVNITNNTIKNAVDKILMKNRGKKKKTCVISLASNENINTGMKVTVPITEKTTITQGSKVYIYKYDIKTKKLIETANHKQTVKKDGSIVIAATSGTDYIVSVKKLKGNQIQTMEDGISVLINKKKVKVGKKLKINILLPDTISTKNTFGTEKATIVYKSSDNKIVSVSKNGMITAKKKGEVMITITIKLASGQKIIKKQKITVK